MKLIIDLCKNGISLILICNINDYKKKKKSSLMFPLYLKLDKQVT